MLLIKKCSSVIKYWYLLFLLAACSNNKKINSSTSFGSKKLHFLPVRISYTGIKIEDSLKYFIAQYLQSKNIEVIDRETGEMLTTNEIRRSTGLQKTADPKEFQKELELNEQYVFNLLTLNFKMDTTGRQIAMGYRIDPEPINFGRPVMGKWKYLTNHTISDSPPQDELKTLCDSIIYSKSLY
jgi:hypothetical protein